MDTKNIIFTAGTTNNAPDKLQPDDYQYLKDRIMHYRHYHSNTEEMLIETARAYEAAKTIVTAFEHLSKKFPFICITVVVNAKDATATANAISLYGESIDITFCNTADDSGNGRFIISQNKTNVPYAIMIAEYVTNGSGMVSYDMIFPAPSNFRNMIHDAVMSNH